MMTQNFRSKEREYFGPEQILAIRNALGMTQEEFARVMGTTTTSISRWERGISNPSKMAIKLLKQMLIEARKEQQLFNSLFRK